jgi:hypothetical protein
MREHCLFTLSPPFFLPAPKPVGLFLMPSRRLRPAGNGLLLMNPAAGGLPLAGAKARPVEGWCC